MLRRSVVLIAVLTAHANAHANAQSAQSGRAPHPDGRLLRLTTDSLEVYVVRHGQSQRTGLIVDRLDTARVNGEVVLRRVYRTNDAVLGTSLDTLIDALPDLHARSVRTAGSRAIEELDWKGDRVTGAVEQKGKAERGIDERVPEGGGYSSASFDVILRASPLAEGYAVAVPAFSGQEGAAVLTARVVGSEDISGYGETWRVDADFSGMSVSFWISKTSRRLVRQVMRIAPGAEIHFVAPRRAAA
jgi:hypothetical protein